MKKHMTRNIILMLVLDVILGIVLALYIANTGTVLLPIMPTPTPTAPTPPVRRAV